MYKYINSNNSYDLMVHFRFHKSICIVHFYQSISTLSFNCSK